MSVWVSVCVCVCAYKCSRVYDCIYVKYIHEARERNSFKFTKYRCYVCVFACVCVYMCVCDTGSRTAEPSPQGSPTLGQQSSNSEDIWVLRKPLAGEGREVNLFFFLWPLTLIYLRVCLCVCVGGERSGSVGSIGSLRSSSSLQNSGNTHVLTTPAPSPHPANTPGGVNTHGLNAPGLHAQAEGVKVRHTWHLRSFTGSRPLIETLPGRSRKFPGNGTLC